MRSELRKNISSSDLVAKFTAKKSKRKSANLTNQQKLKLARLQHARDAAKTKHPKHTL